MKVNYKKSSSYIRNWTKRGYESYAQDMTEREIQGIHEFVYRKYGAADEGYPSIVGAGDNSCVSHYMLMKKEIDNQLVLMDLGAEFYGYTADVTRTIPANGLYSQAQRGLQVFTRHRKKQFRLLK